MSKLELNGNPLKWSKVSSMFIATVDQQQKPLSEKMRLLLTVRIGEAISPITGMGYWVIIGRRHSVIALQLEIFRKASQLKPQNWSGLKKLSFIVSNFAKVLKVCRKFGDLQSSVHYFWQHTNYLSFSKKSGCCMLMTKMKSCMQGF